MRQSESEVKAIFFDLWDTLITGSGDESILSWYKSVTKVESFTFNREECVKIREEDIGDFVREFLCLINAPNSSRLLLSLRAANSPVKESLLNKLKDKIAADSRTIRWLPGAIEVLQALKDKFIIVCVCNAWGYQRPYFLKNLRLKNYFDNVYLSCDQGLEKIDLIKKAISDLSLKPENILIVGDRYDNDVVPATGLGVKALKINTERNLEPSQFLKEIKRALGLENKINLEIKPKKVERCLFIIPPYYKMHGSHNNRINLGISTLAEICIQEGIEAKVYHADSEGSEEYPSRYQILLNSINFYDNLANHHVFEEIRCFVSDYKPDAVVITSGDMLNSFTDTGCWQVSSRVAHEVRLAWPKAYVTSYGPERGKPVDFDSVIADEAEVEFLSIIKNRKEGVLSFRTLPEYELNNIPVFKSHRFVQKISPAGFDITYWRRGCIGRCQFCRVTERSDGGERFRAIERFFEDIEYRYNELGRRHLYFVDPNFTSRKDKVEQFCTEVVKRFPDITWCAESRFDTLDKELLPFLRDAGCTYLKLGLENSLGEDHQAAGKKISLAQAKEKIELLHDYGIKCVVYLMLGGYWYTKSDYERMYENILELGADGYTISLTTPYVGTVIGITHEEWERWEFTGSHLDIRLIDYWKIPVSIIEKFYALELAKGREDRNIRTFINKHK